MNFIYKKSIVLFFLRFLLQNATTAKFEKDLKKLSDTIKDDLNYSFLFNNILSIYE
jgi:hypothetical protein